MNLSYSHDPRDTSLSLDRSRAHGLEKKKRSGQREREGGGGGTPQNNTKQHAITNPHAAKKS